MKTKKPKTKSKKRTNNNPVYQAHMVHKLVIQCALSLQSSLKFDTKQICKMRESKRSRCPSEGFGL